MIIHHESTLLQMQNNDNVKAETQRGTSVASLIQNNDIIN